MRSHICVLSVLFFSVASIVWAGPLDARSGLMKRHFWCNGQDSETICPPGESMVPIDGYACNQIEAAGRLNDITPPVDGETHTTCANATPTSTTPPAAASSTTPAAASSTAPAQTTEPSNDNPKSGTGSSGDSHTVHLKCTKTSGSGDELDLECVTV